MAQWTRLITECFVLEATLKVIWFQPPCYGQGPFHQTRLLKAPSNLALNTWTTLGSLCQGLTTLRAKNSFPRSDLNLPSFSLKPLLLVLSLQALVKSPSPALLQAPSGTKRLFSRLNSPSSLSLPSQERCSSPLIIFMVLLWPHSDRSMSVLCWGLQSCMQDSRWGLTRAEQRGRIPCLNLLATLPLMQPRVQLAFWAAGTHYWLMSSFLSTGTPKFFSSGLLSVLSSPSLCWCWGLPWARSRALPFALLNLTRFARAHSSSLSRSRWMASLPSSIPATLLSLVSSTDLLRMPSVPLFVSLMKTMMKVWNSTSPSADPWGALLVNCFHLDAEPWIVTL